MYWKFLRSGRLSLFTACTWTAGEWMADDNPATCLVGIHACRLIDLPYWLADELWRIELAGEVVYGEHKVVGERARLLGRVEEWTPATARRFGEACVLRTAQHAVSELRAGGYESEARQLHSTSLPDLKDAARAILDALPGRRAGQPLKLCGYVMDAVEAAEAYPVASVAYIAARAANYCSGPADVDLYAAEREWQAQWLSDALNVAAVG